MIKGLVSNIGLCGGGITPHQWSTICVSVDRNMPTAIPAITEIMIRIGNFFLNFSGKRWYWRVINKYNLFIIRQALEKICQRYTVL